MPSLAYTNLAAQSASLTFSVHWQCQPVSVCTYLFVTLLPGSLRRTLKQALGNEVTGHLSRAFTDNTKATYRCHMDSYIAFCTIMRTPPVPATPEVILQYAALLARTLKFSSVKQYLNIIRLLHLSSGLPNPLEGNFNIHYVLRGIQRSIASPPARKRPITPQLLIAILSNLDVAVCHDAAVWAAALLMFYGLLRRSNVLSPSMAQFNPSKHLCRSDLSFHPGGATLSIHWSKTNQFAQRNRLLPLPSMPCHVLCPVKALYNYITLAPHVAGDHPLFVTPSKTGCTPLSPSTFVSCIRKCLTESVSNTSDYAGHSFRRGGASWAFQAGLSVDTIRQLGDWRSNSYMDYIVMDTSSIFKAVQQMQNCL